MTRVADEMLKIFEGAGARRDQFGAEAAMVFFRIWGLHYRLGDARFLDRHACLVLCLPKRGIDGQVICRSHKGPVLKIFVSGCRLAARRSA
jgi:hypothetical protein